MNLFIDLIILLFIIYFVISRIFKNDVSSDMIMTISTICSLFLINITNMSFINSEIQILIAYLFDLEIYQLNHNFFSILSVIIQFLIYLIPLNALLKYLKNIFFSFRLENTKVGNKYLFNQIIIIIVSFFRSIILLTLIIALINSLSFEQNFDRNNSFSSKTYFLLSNLSNILVDDGIH